MIIQIFLRKILEIKCNNVMMSKSNNSSRFLYSNCDAGKNNLFSLKKNFSKHFNSFRGKLKNINPNILFNNRLKENYKFLNNYFNSSLNGIYKIVTNKDYYLQSVNFVSTDTILIPIDNKDKEISKTKLSGTFSWEKKTNALNFSDVLLGNQLVSSGAFDFTTKKGFFNFSIKKMLVEDAKTYLSKFFYSYRHLFEFNLHNFSNKFSSGNFKNLNVKIKFSIFEDFFVEQITGLSKFSNIRINYNDKIFKKLTTIFQVILNLALILKILMITYLV